jgi:hypothetical protein
MTEAELVIVRRAYAEQVSMRYNAAYPRAEAAFAAVRREAFLGPGPWPLLRFHPLCDDAGRRPGLSLPGSAGRPCLAGLQKVIECWAKHARVLQPETCRAGRPVCVLWTSTRDKIRGHKSTGLTRIYLARDVDPKWFRRQKGCSSAGSTWHGRLLQSLSSSQAY